MAAIHLFRNKRAKVIISAICVFVLSCSYPTQVVAGQKHSKEQQGKPGANNRKINGLTDTRLQAEVNSWLGTPYKAGGTSRKGTDCSGFAMSVYKKVYGVDLPHNSREMSKTMKKVRRQGRLKEGDLVFFKIRWWKVSHVGIYLKDDIFVHASTSNGVVLSSLNEKYYKKRFFRGGRVKRKK